MGNKLKIGDDADPKAALDRFPNALSASDFKKWAQENAGIFGSCLQSAAGRSCWPVR
ncbi:hypothetical protein SAMN03159448_05497 [Sinorhizobium sp. NFACC03]|nr:hypothetical protein SAMN03159448_05497 [Sinorhizobium sp. NFACC03]